MIKPEELRIGNLILHKGEVIPVTMIGEFGIQSRTGIQLLNAKFRSLCLEPILLTEDWLLKFGYKKVNKLTDGTDVFLGQPYLYFKAGVISLSINTIDIKYVHQLQNIIYALTGEELK